jgi:dCMP deaminase
MRPSWDDYFMAMAELAASRSTCRRRQVGAVLIAGDHVIATGYNGAPTGIPHCTDVGCLREKLGVPPGERHELCVGVHAEQNAIIQAALHGRSTRGTTLYSTCQPCVLCAKMAINAQIRRIVFQGTYPDRLAVELLTAAGVELVHYRPEGGKNSADKDPGASPSE